MPKNKKQDQLTISDEPHEIKAVAKKFDIQPSQVLFAKEQTGSNDREVVEAYISKHIIGEPEKENNETDT